MRLIQLMTSCIILYSTSKLFKKMFFSKTSSYSLSLIKYLATKPTTYWLHLATKQEATQLGAEKTERHLPHCHGSGGIPLPVGRKLSWRWI